MVFKLKKKKYNVASLPEGRPLKRLLLDGSLRQASLCMSGLNDKGVEALVSDRSRGPGGFRPRPFADVRRVQHVTAPGSVSEDRPLTREAGPFE